VSPKWPGGPSNLRWRKQIGMVADLILHGKMMSVDPASNLAGFARFEAGQKIDSGSITLKGGAIQFRLRELCDRLSAYPTPDVLVIEELQGVIHNHLRWSVAAAMLGARAPDVIFCPIPVWKAVSLVTPGYRKTDENDATCIGQAAILTAREIWTPTTPGQTQSGSSAS